MAISDATTRRILDAARIEEVVGEYVTLRRRGSSLLGLCPFHNEKTPSFHVNTAKNFYHCFGCGAGGGAAKFIMEMEHVSFPDALRILAKKYGIEIEETQMTDAERQAQSERDALIPKYADAFELTGDLGSPISSYSHGMKQKLAIISALVHKPRI